MEITIKIQLPEKPVQFIKKAFSPLKNSRVKRLILLSVALTAFSVYAGSLTIPNTFSSGQVISASQFNDNFSAIQSRVSDLDSLDSFAEGMSISGTEPTLGFKDTNAVTGKLRYNVNDFFFQLCDANIENCYNTHQFSDGRFEMEGTGSGSFSNVILFQSPHANSNWKIQQTTNSHSTAAARKDLQIFFDGPSEYYFSFDSNNGSFLTPHGSFTPSDVRLKKNVKTIESGLAAINKLRAVTYEWIEEPEDKRYKTEVGLIAQEVEKVIPTIVREQKNEMKLKSVQYLQLIPYLIKATQEQDKRIDLLSQQVEELKKQNAFLKKYSQLK